MGYLIIEGVGVVAATMDHGRDINQRSGGRRGWALAVIISVLVLITVCGLSYTSIRHGIITPPAGSFYLGPVGVRANVVVDCRPGWDCRQMPFKDFGNLPGLAPLEPLFSSQYQIWFVVRSSEGSQIYRLVTVPLESPATDQRPPANDE